MMKIIEKCRMVYAWLESMGCVLMSLLARQCTLYSSACLHPGVYGRILESVGTLDKMLGEGK